MKKIKDFINAWGSFIALCLIIATLLAAFIAIECACESAFLRILGGVLTMMPCGILTVIAVLDFGPALEEWNDYNAEEIE